MSWARRYWNSPVLDFNRTESVGSVDSDLARDIYMIPETYMLGKNIKYNGPRQALSSTTAPVAILIHP
jgi:hypothetical protein